MLEPNLPDSLIDVFIMSFMMLFILYITNSNNYSISEPPSDYTSVTICTPIRPSKRFPPKNRRSQFANYDSLRLYNIENIEFDKFYRAKKIGSTRIDECLKISIRNYIGELQDSILIFSNRYNKKDSTISIEKYNFNSGKSSVLVPQIENIRTDFFKRGYKNNFKRIPISLKNNEIRLK